MANHKRKAIATATRGTTTLHVSAPDRSIILDVKALSSSSFPPLASAVCSRVLEPIPKAVPGPASLYDIIVDDCSEDDVLAGHLLEEERLDFSFTDEDCEELLPSSSLFPPSTGLVPTPLSSSCPPSTTVVAGSSPPSSGKVWTDLFSTNKPSSPCTKLQNFSLNHLTKTYTISLEDFQPQFDVWNLCAVGYVSGKSPGYRALNGIISSIWKCEASLTIHASRWFIYRFRSEEAKSSILHGGPYLSPPCLSKIASVLGKPIQCDHMMSSLSRLSYARVLVELDLREDLQHFVAVSLPSGSILKQKVVYEALPKFCNFCNVLGHTQLLCPNAAASLPPTGIPSPVAGTRSVFQRLGLQIPASSVSQHDQPLLVQGPSKDSSAAAIMEPEQAPCDDSSDG
ncbi:hypothetical protein Peur_030576 [Populus x canadensis]